MVDDDEDDKDFFAEALKEVDPAAVLTWVSDGIHALKLLESDGYVPPDYIFLDLNMPRLGGKMCLQKIRKIQALSSVPVIIYTTSKFSEQIFSAVDTNELYFLTKPTRIEDLKKYLQEILQKNKQWIHMEE